MADSPAGWVIRGHPASRHGDHPVGVAAPAVARAPSGGKSFVLVHGTDHSAAKTLTTQLLIGEWPLVLAVLVSGFVKIAARALCGRRLG